MHSTPHSSNPHPPNTHQSEQPLLLTGPNENVVPLTMMGTSPFEPDRLPIPPPIHTDPVTLKHLSVNTLPLSSTGAFATESRKKILETVASNHLLVDPPLPFKSLTPDDWLNPNDPSIKQDIVRMIVQYLNDEGFQASKMTLHDETSLRLHEQSENQLELRRLRKAILEGDWQEVDKLVSKPMVKNHKAFLYAIYKQQYLEYIEHHEIQKAFTFLNKRIKPLEQFQTTLEEFRDLCYLLTGKSVHDASSFKHWEGIGPGREKLVEHLQSMMSFDSLEREVYVPPNRLVTLLKQAATYQVGSSRYHPKTTTKIPSLLSDYTPYILPNAIRHRLEGHTANVKCVQFLGDAGATLASGSSDTTVRVWDVETGAPLTVLHGHTSRVWDLTSNRSGTLLGSASGDGTLRLWSLPGGQCSAIVSQHQNDVYSLQLHPAETHLASGGYDKFVRFFDLPTTRLVKTFAGHTLAVTHVTFSPMGNLLVSCSKDSTIQFWDLVSGLSIKTLRSHFGEVTSVDMSPEGTYVLSCSKDNSNRVWDLRMLRATVSKLKGHQHTSKNFIRAHFAQPGVILGGSEDHLAYIWDQHSGELLKTLHGHRGIVYSLLWHPKQALFASCSDDRSILTWYYNDSLPVF